MIPRLDIEPRQDVDLDRITAPGRESVRYPWWLGTQRDYDPYVYDEATWESAQEALDEERALVEDIGARAGDEEDFNDLAYEEFEAEGPLYDYGVELGLNALVRALNAAGCITASSCRGHPDSARDLPQVILACDRPRAELLVRVARQAGCGIENFENSGLVIYSPSVAEFLDLAERLLRSRADFNAIPLTAERRDPAETADEFEGDPPLSG